MDLHGQFEISAQEMADLIIGAINSIKTMRRPPLEELVDDLNQLKIMTEKEMRTTPMTECRNKYKIRSYENELKTAEKEVEFLRCLLQEEISKFKEFRKETTIDIATEESIMRSIKDMVAKKLADEIKKCEYEKIAVYKEYQMKILRAKIASFENKIQLIDAENAAREQYLRIIRLEKENKSIELLKQYDQEIGSKYQLLEKLNIQNNNLKDEQEELRVRFTNQNELYVNLKEEKEKATEIAFLERATHFTQNLAAKVIQKTWRLYRERQLLKRKRKTKRK